MHIAAKRAALYLRSSKDRHDSSPDAQRRGLTALAQAKGLVVAAEFLDVVEAANDTNRPGFQALLREIKSPARAWQTLIVMDTARIARNVYLIEVFKQECRRADVRLVFEKLPEVNPMVDMVVQQVMQAFDQMHSMMSREKGLAGMSENVKQGWRAGGRAPLGYRLEHVATGAIRDGQPVTKSKLAPTDDAPAVGAYLRGRALGLPAAELAKRHGITLSSSGLNGLEWNALTYAGATVWNVHAVRSLASGGYEKGVKRRPREEWVVQPGTHEALITAEEAEAILARLDSRRATRMRSDDYLLSGILYTPEGTPWHGNVGYYRAGKISVSAKNLETAVLAKVGEDLVSAGFVRAMLDAAQSGVNGEADKAELAAGEKKLAAVNQRIARLASLIAEAEAPRALLEKLSELEADRARLEEQMQGLRQASMAAKTMTSLTEADIRDMLRGIAEGLESMERGAVKALLRSQIRRITLKKGNAGDLKACFDYAIPVETGVKMASPRGTGVKPTSIGVRKTAVLRVPRRGQRSAAF